MKMRTQLIKPAGHSKGRLKGKFGAVSTHIRTLERSLIHSLKMYLKLLEK
jgi:hypothetical protein